MKTFLIIYGIVAILSGIWSIRMQKKYHPTFKELWRFILVFFLNSIGWPITLTWAVINKQLW